MKNRISKRIAIALVMTAFAAFLAGCGSPNSTVNNVPIGTGTTYNTGSCIPISQPIGFTATSLYADYINVDAGPIPTVDAVSPGKIFGQTALSTANVSGQYQFPNSLNPYAPDGSISMNITPNGSTTQVTGSGNTYTGAYNGAGTIMISAIKQQMINQTFGTAQCVYAVGIRVSRNGYNLYGGKIYLYLINQAQAGQLSSTMSASSIMAAQGHGTIINI